MRIVKQKTTVPGFGARLKSCRERRGILAGELAAKLGVTAPTISMLEADKRGPSANMIIRLAQALGVPTDDLLMGSIPTTKK